MQNKILVQAALLLLLILSSNLAAEQLSFKKVRTGDQTKFSYKWKDVNSDILEFDFKLATKNVNSDFRHFKALTPSRLQMYSVKKLKQAIAKLDPRKGSVKIQPRYQNVDFEFRSTDRDWMKQQSAALHQVYNSSLKEFLHKEYYIEFQPIGYKADKSHLTYKPDHVRFAKESQQSFRPLIKSLSQKLPGATARTTSIFLLSFFQSIPYSTLESRVESNGAGFSPPIKVLANNRGDCDSKVTLMASIIKAMYPKLQIIIVYIPDHALIGLHVSHLNTDYRLDVEGLHYTLAEPTGPGLIEFAEISERSRRFIDSGIYQVESF